MSQSSTPRQLKALFSLDHNIKLYIPSTKDIDKAADNGAYITEALELFGQLFGGATSYDASGAWVSQSHGLVVEAVKIVESYATSEAVAGGIESVLRLALKIKRELNQEAVSLEYDNRLYFV